MLQFDSTLKTPFSEPRFSKILDLMNKGREYLMSFYLKVRRLVSLLSALKIFALAWGFPVNPVAQK